MKLIFLTILTLTAKVNAMRTTADCSSIDGKITASFIMKGLTDIPDFGKILVDGTPTLMRNTTPITMIGKQRQFVVGTLTFIQYRTSSDDKSDGVMVFDLNGVALGNMKCCFDGADLTVINNKINCG